MARSWQYPRWRRYVMQFALWLVLAGTIALAAFVDHRKNAALRVALSPVAEHRDVSVALPKRWQVVQGIEDDPLVVVEAKEPQQADEETGGPPVGRTLAVLHQRTVQLMSPVEYLSRVGVKFEGSADTISDPSLRIGFTQTTVAGHVGVLVVGWHKARPMRGHENDPEIRKELYACTVLPKYGAITVKLEGFGFPDRSDVELVRQVAQSIAVNGDEPAASSDANAGEIDWPGRARVAAPDGFRVIASSDPNSTERQLLRDATLEQWTAIDLVPCVFFPGDTLQTLTTLLATRDPKWRVAPVQAEGPGRFRVDSPIDLPRFPSRAYLTADKTGHALLAIFHGGGDGDQSFEPTWQAIVEGIRFPETREYEAMLTVGADEANRLSDEGLDKILTGERRDAWWLWHRESPEHSMGWTSLRFEDSSRWRATSETRYRLPSRRLLRATQSWDAAGDLKTYRASIARSEAGGAADQRFVDTLKQTINLTRGKISITMTAGNLTLPAGGLNAPPQYIPGGVLPLLVGALSPKAMILKSESFIASEGDAGPGLLTLIVRPSDDDRRTLEGETEPMRCVTVEVNGSGEISRWYFRSDGTVENVDFPEGLRRVRSDLQQIRMAFGGDARMMP